MENHLEVSNETLKVAKKIREPLDVPIITKNKNISFDIMTFTESIPKLIYDRMDHTLMIVNFSIHYEGK